MSAFETVGDQVQIGLAIAQGFERADGFNDVVAIVAGAAVALPYIVYAFVNTEPAGILHMAAIDDVAERLHLPPRLVFKLDPPHRLQIDAGDLLTGPQIRDRFLAFGGGDAVGDAAAHTAAIKPHHQTGPFRGSPMNEGIHAKRAVHSDKLRRHLLEYIETRPPHQRAVAKDPEIVLAVLIDRVHPPR